MHTYPCILFVKTLVTMLMRVIRREITSIRNDCNLTLGNISLLMVGYFVLKHELHDMNHAL